MTQSDSRKSDGRAKAAGNCGKSRTKQLMLHQPAGHAGVALRSASDDRRRGGHPGFPSGAREFPRASVHFVCFASFEKNEKFGFPQQGGGRA